MVSIKYDRKGGLGLLRGVWNCVAFLSDSCITCCYSTGESMADGKVQQAWESRVNSDPCSPAALPMTKAFCFFTLQTAYNKRRNPLLLKPFSEMKNIALQCPALKSWQILAREYECMIKRYWLNNLKNDFPYLSETESCVEKYVRWVWHKCRNELLPAVLVLHEMVALSCQHAKSSRLSFSSVMGVECSVLGENKESINIQKIFEWFYMSLWRCHGYLDRHYSGVSVRVLLDEVHI